MILQQQVCSLELAKRLKQLGLRQVSHFRWIDDFVRGEDDVKSYGYEECWGDEEFWSTGIAAFTVAELGEMLPDIILDGTTFGLEYGRRDEADGRRHMVAYTPISAVVPSLAFINDIGTEADARAKMPIYLIENKLTTLP